jgi:hypothetical protein
VTDTNPTTTVTAQEVAGREVAFSIDHGDGRQHHVWLRSDQVELSLSGPALLAAALLPSMQRGTALHGDLPIDDRCRAGLDRAQQVLATWHPELTPVAIEAPSGPSLPPEPRTGSFFTGGVDSFHAALTWEAEVDDLVFVHGFDVPLTGAPRLREAVVDGLHRMTGDLSRPLIEIETNLHEYSDAVGSPWGTHYHGPALAVVAHVLGARLGQMLVASTHDYTDQFPWGSHPLLDPLWSSSAVALEHVGGEADRVDKIALLAQSPTAMANLRVCWQNPDETYNCGRCLKCIRTMIALEIVGALDRCATLPDEIDLDAVRTLPIPNRNILARHAELLRHLRASGEHAELLAACEDNLRVVGPGNVDWGTGWTTIIPELFGVPGSP